LNEGYVLLSRQADAVQGFSFSNNLGLPTTHCTRQCSRGREPKRRYGREGGVTIYKDLQEESS